MKQAVFYSAHKELNLEILYLIARFGRRHALIAVLRTFWKGKGRPPDAVTHMSNHLRRDIGLPEISEPTQRPRSEKV